MYTKKVLCIVLLHICFSAFCAHKTLFPLKDQKDDSEETKKKQLVTQWHYEPWWSLLARSPIDKDPDLWTQYIQALQEGREDHVRTLLPRMATGNTYPKYYFNRTSVDLPIDDCSGLAAVVEAKTLSDEAKITLMHIIINFYQPKKAQCNQNWFSSCNLLCNQRRAALIAYGRAKAGESCLKLKGSDVMLKEIYGSPNKAFITQDALNILQIQGKIVLLASFTALRTTQHETKRLLSDFNCFHHGSDAKYSPSEYYHQIAQPVITGSMPYSDCCTKQKLLCKRG